MKWRTITLTAGADFAAPIPPLNPGDFDEIFLLTDRDDTIEATNLTFNNGDVIVDQTTDDNDTLNLTTTASIVATPEVRNIENINVEVSRVGQFNFAADDITHDTGNQTFTFNRYDLQDGAISGAGAVAVTAATAGTYVAGTKVTNFTVTFAENDDLPATVNGMAATGLITVNDIDEAGVTVMAAADQDVMLAEIGGTDSVATVMTSGEATITNGVAGLTLDFQGDSDTTLTAIGADGVTLQGTADVVLNVAAGDLDGATVVNEVDGAVNIVVDAAADMDLEEVDAVASIELVGDFAGKKIDVNDQQLITTADDQTGTVNFDATGLNSTARFAALADVTVATLDFGNVAPFETVHLYALGGSLEATVAVDVNGAELALFGENDITIFNVLDAASIVSTATGNVTLKSSGNADEQVIILQGGDDDIEVASDTNTFLVNIIGGDNTLTITDAGADSQFVTGDGADTVTIVSGVANVVTVTTGAGDDELILDDASAHMVNLGTGANTLILTGNADATDATIALGAGANTIVLDSATDVGIADATITGNVSAINLTTASDLEVTSAQFAGFGSFTLDGIAGSSLTVTGTATADTIDGSVITPAFGAGSTVNLNGLAGNDTITTSKFATTLAGGADDDTFVFFQGSGNTGTIIDEITDFTTGDNSIKTGTAGTLANTSIVDSTGVADYDAALIAANAWFDGVADRLYYVAEDVNSEGASYLFINWTNNDVADQAIELAGVAVGVIEFGDIIA